MNKIPTYSALIENGEDGITTISWVTNPATQVDMICFSEDDKQKYTFAEDDKQLVTSVVMLADTKIYRNNGGFEYYITYSKDTLIQMCEKMLKDNTFNTISFEHDGNVIENGRVSLVELYTVDDNKKSPFNVPKGSIIATYKVNDVDLWPLFKSGEIGGISLEGYFTIKEVEEKYKTQHKTMFEKIKDMIKSVLVEFAAVSTDKGILYAESEDLQEGMEVTNEEGQSVEDGDYTLEDGTIVTVVNSVIEKIEKPEIEETVEDDVTEEVETAEEETEETVEDVTEETTEDDVNKTIDELKAKIDAFKSEIDVLKETISNIQSNMENIMEKINAPMNTPIVEEYEEMTTKNDKWSKIGNALKK